MKLLHIDEAIGIPAAIFGIMYFLLHLALPSSYWFEVNRFEVADAAEGEPIIIEYDRTIAWHFWADWRVEVTRINGSGVSQACSTVWQREDYDPEETLPDPVTLAWFAYTDPKCFNLPPGDYRVTATWFINPIGLMRFLLGRTASVSDTFTITPGGGT